MRETINIFIFNIKYKRLNSDKSIGDEKEDS